MSIQIAIAIAAVAISCLAQSIGLDASYPKNQPDPYAVIRRLRAQGKHLSQPELKALGMAYHAVGQHLLFRQMMQQAIAADPRDPQPHLLLGRHYGSDVDDFAAAATHFRAARERKPSPDATAYLGHALEMLGEKENAVTMYREATAAEPCHGVAAAGLARLGLASAGDLAKCESSDPTLLRELAKLLAAQGRHAEAASCLEQVLAAEPTDATIAYQLHRTYRAANQHAKAQEALARFKRLHSIYGGR